MWVRDWCVCLVRSGAIYVKTLGTGTGIAISIKYSQLWEIMREIYIVPKDYGVQPLAYIYSICDSFPLIYRASLLARV